MSVIQFMVDKNWKCFNNFLASLTGLLEYLTNETRIKQKKPNKNYKFFNHHVWWHFIRIDGVKALKQEQHQRSAQETENPYLTLMLALKNLTHDFLCWKN